MAERPALEAVLFDAGGTLVRLDFEWMSEMIRALGHEITPGALARAEVEARRAFDDGFDAPLCTDEDMPRFGSRGDPRLYLGMILEKGGLPAHRIDAALARFVERQAGPGLWTRPVEGARGCLDALAKLGLRLACVSNSDGRAEYHLESCDVCRGLEFVVDSGLEGVEKPHPGIFRIALERLGVPAERALYVGDLRVIDGRGARSAGLHFVLLDPYGDYALPGEPAIDSIAALPVWIRTNFDVGAGRGRETR
ncbi:MAG TPA: HAD-IA family hydrolase [Terriglobales bacterium]|nr:HAD-IA family hydrolase [Terriglobales bacterium]